MKHNELNSVIERALADAGYTGDVFTLRRKQQGHVHTIITRPSEDLDIYLSGYLKDDAEIVRHPITGTITVVWAEMHEWHWTVFGTYWCDTCNTPYCDLA